MPNKPQPEDGSRWRVVVYMKSAVKYTLVMGDNDGADDMAHEHARLIVERGPFIDDDRGVRTYFPPHDVDKVKVVPPGVELNKTEVRHD